MPRRSSRIVKVVSQKPSEPEEGSSKVTGKKRARSSEPNKIVKGRKRLASNDIHSSDVDEDAHTDNESTNDLYCWKCHKEGVDLKCSNCPRSFHEKCLTRVTAMNENKVCSSCQDEAQESQEDEEMDGDQLTSLLCCIIKNAYLTKGLTDHLSVWEPAPNNKLVHIVDYRYIMDRAKNAEGDLKYKSHKQLMNDVMWMLHNTMIMYSDSRTYVNAAKLLVESFNSEVDMFLNCRTCYIRENDEVEPFFFYKPCDTPHPLIWAKIRFHPFWPAMAYRVVNKKVCVRFFGTYQVSYVPMSDCYFLSEKYPGPEKKGDRLLRAFTELEACTSTFESMYGKYLFQPNKATYDHRTAMDMMKALKKQPTVVITSENSPLLSSKITGIQEKIVESQNNIPAASISEVHIEDDVEAEQDVKVQNNFNIVISAVASAATQPRQIAGADIQPRQVAEAAIQPATQSNPVSNVSDLDEDVVHLSEAVVSSTLDSDPDVITIDSDDDDEERYLGPLPPEIRKNPDFAVMQRYMRQDRIVGENILNQLKQESAKLVIPLFNIIFPMVQSAAAKHNPSNLDELRSYNENLENTVTRFQKKLKNADLAVKYMAHSKEKENLKFQNELESKKQYIESLKAALTQANVDNNILMKERELSDNAYEQQIKKLKEDKNTDWCTECKYEQSQFLCCNSGSKIYKFCSSICAKRSKHNCNKEKQSPALLGLPESSAGVSSVVQRQLCSIEYVRTQVVTSQTSSNSHMDHMPQQENLNTLGNNF